MTSRAERKLQKLSDSLRKQTPSIKLKDLTKFVDLLASNIQHGFDLELFEFARDVRIEQDHEGIVRYLIDNLSREPLPKKIVALEIINKLVNTDAPTREKFLVSNLMPILVSLLPSVRGGDQLAEALGVQILKVIACFAEQHSRFLSSDELTNNMVRQIITLARTVQTDNEVLHLSIGAALMPFYLNKTYNKGDTWNNEPIKYLLMAAQSGKVRIHKEIPAQEVNLEQEIFQSPLCKVFRGTWAGHSVAVKKFSQYSLGFSWEDFYKEVGLLSVAQHPNVVIFYGAFANNGRTEEPFIVLEYLAKGDLHDVVVDTFKVNAQGFSKTRLALISVDIAKGLAYLHQLGIIHRDIKTSNFLVADDMTVKMIDFGVSRVMSTSVIMTTVGTPTFMAPEVLNGEMYSELADVYSFAMVMYECLTGKEPFHDVNGLQLAGKVIGGARPPIPSPCHVDGFVQIMQQCWAHDVAERPSFKEALVALFQLKRLYADQESRRSSAPAPASARMATSQVPHFHSQPHHHAISHTPNHATQSSSSASSSLSSSGKKPSSTDPRDYNWYYGKVSKDAAINLLLNKPVGTFIVRASSREGCYAASVVFADGIRHILIQPGAGGRFIVDALDNKNYNFRSIPAVVKSYSNILKVPCPKPGSETYGAPPPYAQNFP